MKDKFVEITTFATEELPFRKHYQLSNKGGSFVDCRWGHVCIGEKLYINVSIASQHRLRRWIDSHYIRLVRGSSITSLLKPGEDHMPKRATFWLMWR